MSTDSANDALALMIIYLCTKSKRPKEKKKKRVWMKDWLYKRYQPAHTKLLKNGELTATEQYNNFLRMDSETYQELLNYITPFIQKQNTVMREAITPNERLSATLQFLATGQSYEELKYVTNFSAQSLGRFIIETCEAITTALKPFIQMPTNAEQWNSIATEFEKKCNLKHCIGAIDGRHINIAKPSKSGSHYLNYKNKFSIIMMAVVNANYEFITVEIGAKGKTVDAGVFAQSELKQNYDDGLLNLPKPDKLPLSEENFPYVFVGNDAFPLLENLMKPYSRHNLTKEQEIFNQRLARAQCIVETTFEILANRFKILQTKINLSPEKATLLAVTCCYLHNFLKQRNPSIYLENSNTTVTKEEEYTLTSLEPLKHYDSSINSKTTRHKFTDYFNAIDAAS